MVHKPLQKGTAHVPVFLSLRLYRTSKHFATSTTYKSDRQYKTIRTIFVTETKQKHFRSSMTTIIMETEPNAHMFPGRGFSRDTHPPHVTIPAWSTIFSFVPTLFLLAPPSEPCVSACFFFSPSPPPLYPILDASWSVH